MRYAVVKAWAIVAASLLAAAAADAAMELAGNNGWLGAGLPDNQHESIVPTLVTGIAVTLALLLSVFFARVAPRASLARMTAMQTRYPDIALAFCGSLLCVMAMEGYETRFGGLSPFDPRSIVLSHALTLLVASLAIVTAIHWALRAAIRVTRRASLAVAGFVVEFFRERRHAAPDRTAILSAFELFVTPVPLGVARGARGLRAPPPSILLATI